MFLAKAEANVLNLKLEEKLRVDTNENIPVRQYLDSKMLTICQINPR